MVNKITESTLEMHYHKALMDALKDCYGVGPKGQFSFFKYSPQKEKFIGFDQAYVRTEVDDDDFYNDIKKIASGTSTSKKYAGFFLQFKVVDIRVKKSKLVPLNVSSTPPFFSVKLTTDRDAYGNLSQHELLRNIRASSPQAIVYYVCPMLFEKLDLYVDDPNLDLLRMVDVESSQSDFSDNKSHHIFFKNMLSQPVWCSEPRDGIALTIKEFIERVKELDITPQQHADLLLLVIENQKLLTKFDEKEEPLSATLKLLSDSLYLISYGE